MQCGGMNIQQDAVYGVNKDPDVYLLFSWPQHAETGVRYSHFDILIPASPDDLNNKNALWIPTKAPFQEPMSKSAIYRLDDEQRMFEEHEQ